MMPQCVDGALVRICFDKVVKIFVNLLFKQCSDVVYCTLFIFKVVGLKFRIVNELDEIITMKIKQYFSEFFELISTDHKGKFLAAKIYIPTNSLKQL